jgi:uncharacterized membrane protein
MKLLKLLGTGYVTLGLMVLLALFIRDCVANDKFLLHFIGIFVVIPALAYSMWRLYDDISEYVRASNIDIRRPLRLIFGKKNHS